MMKQSEILTNGGAALCGWCGIALGSANTFKENVCVRCHHLLRNAGIGDEEIFFKANADCNNHFSRNTTETDADPTKK